jgi:transcriptional regulator with XRE-family HTH domain
MNPENRSYTHSTMAGGRPPQKEAPPFGKRLTAIRREKGLTQKELAELLGTTQKMVDYYERRAINPALEVVRSCARALGVPMVELLGQEAAATLRRKPGPVSQLERRFERVKQLPRSEQEFVIKFLDTVLERRQGA